MYYTLYIIHGYTNKYWPPARKRNVCHPRGTSRKRENVNMYYVKKNAITKIPLSFKCLAGERRQLLISPTRVDPARRLPCTRVRARAGETSFRPAYNCTHVHVSSSDKVHLNSVATLHHTPMVCTHFHRYRLVKRTRAFVPANKHGFFTRLYRENSVVDVLRTTTQFHVKHDERKHDTRCSEHIIQYMTDDPNVKFL